MDDTNDPEWPSTTSRKRKGEADDQGKSCVPSKQSGNTKVCVIHHESVKDDDNLISPRTFNSWTTILNAATVRQYTAITDIVSSLNEHEVPDIAYHRDCRSLFTMKRDLEALSLESKETVRESPSKFRLSSRRSSVAGPSRVYDAICIFCERKSKYKKKSKTKEGLMKCVELRGDDSIRKSALYKKDQRILALASRELVAAEAHYHQTCYNKYTRCLYETDNVDTDAESVMEVEDKSYDKIENEAFIMLSDWVRHELFPTHCVITMRKLLEKHVCIMNTLGVTEIKRSTRTHFRRKIETEFGNAVSILHDDSGRLLVVPGNVTVHDLAKTNQCLVKELEERKQRDATDNTELIKQAAQILRADIKEKECERDWPPSLEDIEGYEIQSKLTKNFLTILLTGNTKETDSSDRIQRLVNSFAQDFIYAISAGTIKTPKHILLPFAVKSLTGNAELIRMLNRLGHGVSYSQVEEIDTALCLQKLARTEDECVALPVNIKPHVQTTLAWDNIDRLEETLTGQGTSHRVNGIAVQARVFGPEPQKLDAPVHKSRRRTIDHVVEDLPVYNSGVRVGPPVMHTAEVDYFGITRKAWLKNLVWILVRQLDHHDQSVSSWTGFNILCRSSTIVQQDSIGYLPTVNFPATDLSTVFEVLNRSVMIMRSLKLNNIVCVFDQALYAKATEIVWKHRDKFSGLVLRMGTFHTICTLLGIIGKRFQDAGLKDLCVEAGVVASGSTAGVMEGRKYNRAIRVHKLCYEALMRLIWKGFLAWIETDQQDAQEDLDTTMQCVGNLKEEVSEENMNDTTNETSFVKVAELLSEYLQHLRNGNGTLSTFWMSYIDIVEVLFNMIRASREADWQLHLASIRTLIPWCFAYDRLNYARYLPAYYAEMKNLEEHNQEVHNYLTAGGFSVQLGPDNPFGRIPVDQTIEETVNKDTQTAGGTKGFSLKAGTISRYYLTAEYRSAFLRYLRQMLCLDDSGISHGDLMLPRIQKDEADVVAIMDMLETSWVNPFSSEKLDIISLSTAASAPDNVVYDLLNAYAIGERKYAKFKEERLEASPPIVKFHDRIPKQNLKTLSDINKKKKVVRVSGKEIILRADKNLFGNMLIIAQGRKLDMKEVLSHPLGPIPWTLAHPDGSLRSTTKSELKRSLEKNAIPCESFKKPACCIIDGMALIQKTEGDRITFAEIADKAFGTVLREGYDCQRIDVVFDVYREVSIKQTERDKRGEDTGTKFKNIAPGHRVQLWRAFLSSSDNKSSFIKFLASQWTDSLHREKLNEKILYVTCEEDCHKVTKDGVSLEEKLHSTQEEADTRLLLHAHHASISGSKSVVIVSEDTDVFLLCLAYQELLSAEIVMKCGSQNRVRYIDITKLMNAIGKDMCQALLGMHAFTGCDTVSAFFGKGKAKALRIVQTDNRYRETFKQLGKEWVISEHTLKQLESFTCILYDQINCEKRTVNELRYKLFVAKRGEAESSQLPPCKDCLIMHAARANYQVGIWRRCLEQEPDIPYPIDHRWVMDAPGILSVDWMHGPLAPEDVLEMLSCKCTRQCTPPDCICMKNGLKCTYMCKLQTCVNMAAAGDIPEYFDSVEELDGEMSDGDEEEIE